jgi:predicted amidohydrolase
VADARRIRVLAVQPALRWLEPMPNMHHLRQTLEAQVGREPVDLIVLPEVFNGMPAEYDPEAGRLARQFLSTLARACGAAVVGGSIDRVDESGARRNTCHVMDMQGRELGHYDKHVLFALEQERRVAGREAAVFEIAGARVGVMICADLWDPALARNLANDVDVLCVAAKTSVPNSAHVEYARRLWWSLALTRGMENGHAVVVSDWAEGRHEATHQVEGKRLHNVHYTSGGSSIVDPGRRPQIDEIQQTLSRGQEGMLTVAVDLDGLERYRAYRRSVGLLPREGWTSTLGTPGTTIQETRQSDEHSG